MLMHLYVSFRLHSLEASCDTLPTSLILVKKEEDDFKAVLGHSKITPIPSIPDGGFIETGQYYSVKFLGIVGVYEQQISF